MADRARFVHADALDVPSIVERADVVTVFLTIAGLSVVGPYLADVLRPGAIVVSNTFAVPGWRPESVVYQFAFRSKSMDRISRIPLCRSPGGHICYGLVVHLGELHYILTGVED